MRRVGNGQSDSPDYELPVTVEKSQELLAQLFFDVKMEADSLRMPFWRGHPAGRKAVTHYAGSLGEHMRE
jgi:hypothetical protein